MKRKKGYALLMTVVVVSLLLILASSVLALSVSAYKASKEVEKVNKLKLVAESGIEKGKLLLKNYILVNTNKTTATPGVLGFNYLTFNPYSINTTFPLSTGTDTDRDYHDGGIHVLITFGPDTSGTYSPFVDLSTGRTIKYIEIKVTASEGSASKTYSVILDKASLTNVYFNQIFNTTMTTADHISNVSGTTPSFQVNAAVNLDITGNLFLQGSNLNISGASLVLNEGKIIANTDNITGTTNLAGVKLFKNPAAIANTSSGWVNTVPRYLETLTILDHNITYPNADPIMNLDLGLPDQTTLSNNIKFQTPVDPFSLTPISGNPTLITYKVGTTTAPIMFQNLITGTDRMHPLDFSLAGANLYETVVNKLMSLNSYTQDQAKENYKTIYKLILVNGDLTIDDDYEEQFINYLVYCTGTVTFKGEAHFYNSSIFAKNINILNSPGSKGVQFYGVNTNKSLTYTASRTLNNFSDTDKQIINDYLIKNLDNYADSFEYKVVQWK